MASHYYTQTQSSLHILAALLLLLLLILCSQSSLICGEPLSEYNIDNSSSIISWTNISSYVPNYSDAVGSSRAILFRQITSSTSFACGLICDDLGTTCLFGVLYSYYNWRYNQHLVWSAIQKRTVTVNASMELRRDGGLFLMDSDGSLVWSTHTNSNGSRRVSGLELRENGNLVIFGQNNETIWQSFDYPVDVIPSWQGQVKRRSMELIRGSISTTNYGEDWVPLSLVLLFRQSSIYNDAMFACGLICDDLGTTCLFGVLLFRHDRQQDTDIPNELTLDYQSLVWSANRNHPVTVNASVELRRDGGLLLMDSNGTVVWSTHTNGNPALGLNLTENGNLVIFGQSNETIWQSFDHPTDTLLPGQLMPGQTLNASISKSNFEEGSYSVSIGDDYSVRAYLRSSNAYWYEYTPVMGVYVNFSKYWQNYEFLKFEPDGHLAAYGWSSPYESDVFAIGFCGYPLACGRYGVCEYDQYCNCPPGLSLFTQINTSQPSQGCSLITLISCEHSQLHTLLEMKDTTYIGQYLLNEFGEYRDLESCKKACLRNCSCKAAHFNGHYSKGYCLLLNEVLSLVTTDVGNNISVYLKLQNSSTILQSHPWILQRHAKTILGTTGASLAVVLTIIAVYLSLVRKKKVQLKDDEEFLDGVPGLPTRFSYKDLSAMTQNFSRKLGEGGFGSVFEGALFQGTKIAVKRLKEVDQIKSSFLAEVATLGSMDHANLVKLIGFCAAKSQRLLVYEHMANGSLDKWIFNGKQQQQEEHGLTWQTKKKIMSDVAKGLAYLHEDCNQKIIHLDIKPQNILLDQNFNAKVADFGLSKLVAKDQSKVITTMRGTPGYIAPECTSLIITEKVDVYSFGIVMLETVCRRKNVDWDQAEEEVHLLSVFKRKIEEDKVGEMFDMYNKDMEVQKEEGIEMMRIAGWCLQSEYTKRPSMSEVVKALQGLATVDNNLNLDYNFSNQEGETAPDATSNTILIPSILSGPR
nr:G-type lectin S-receptor-like serine/threonine-protein kinase SD2-5 [Ipomoea batatas]